MTALIDDPTVDGLRIVWVESNDYSGPRIVDSPPQLRMIRDFLSRDTWQHFVRFILPGILDRRQRVAEYSGFRFPNDLDADEESFDCVELYDPIDTIHISQGAFDRLMSRYIQTIIDGVTAHERPELREAWWPEIVAAARRLATTRD